MGPLCLDLQGFFFFGCSLNCSKSQFDQNNSEFIKRNRRTKQKFNRQQLWILQVKYFTFQNNLMTSIVCTHLLKTVKCQNHVRSPPLLVKDMNTGCAFALLSLKCIGVKANIRPKDLETLLDLFLLVAFWQVKSPKGESCCKLLFNTAEENDAEKRQDGAAKVD